MIDYIKNNYLWIGSVIVPILIAFIGGIIKLFMKSGRNQEVGDINGNGNVIINGDVTEHSKKQRNRIQ